MRARRQSVACWPQPPRSRPPWGWRRLLSGSRHAKAGRQVRTRVACNGCNNPQSDMRPPSRVVVSPRGCQPRHSPMESHAISRERLRSVASTNRPWRTQLIDGRTIRSTVFGSPAILVGCPCVISAATRPVLAVCDSPLSSYVLPWIPVTDRQRPSRSSGGGSGCSASARMTSSGATGSSG